MTKRVLAFLMVIAMVFSLVPTVAVAVEPEAEGAAAFEVILQKSHNQPAAGSVTVDIYLKAAAESTVTTFEILFDKALSENVVADGKLAASIIDYDADGNVLQPGTVDENGEAVLPIDSDTKLLYPPEEEAIVVGTSRVKVGSLVFAPEADWVADTEISFVEVATADALYTNDETRNEAAEYDGSVDVIHVASNCTQENCGHNQEGTWNEFTATSGELAAGKYYLTGDVQLTGILDVAADAEVTVCLNGYDITGAGEKKQIFMLSKVGSKLNICDCTATGEGEDYTAGRLLPTGNQGGALRTKYGANAEINFFGGIIDGSLSTKKEASVILLYGPSTLNVLGGKIEGFDAGYNQNYGPIIIRGDQDGNQATAYFANVTFVNCGSSIISGAVGDNSGVNTKAVTLENVTVMNSADSTRAVALIDRLKNVTLKGNCKFDAPVYVPNGTTLTLDLGAQADVSIVTEDLLTEDEFNARVKLAEGGSLTESTVFYETGSVYVGYDDTAKCFKIQGKEHMGKYFKAWTSTTTLPTEPGNWYLENDVTLTAQATIPNGVANVVSLDLNGKTVTCGSSIRAYENYGTLNLYDSSSTYEKVTDEEGNITYKWVSAGTGEFTGYTGVRGVVNVHTGGTMNMYGGRIKDNGTDASYSVAPAIYVSVYESGRATQPGAIFNMYGGEITENKSAAMGAAIGAHVNDKVTVPDDHTAAQINIYGGKIYNNTTQASGITDSQGEGTISARGKAVITIAGGEIYDNTAVRGGAVFEQGTSTLNITGGEIKNNTALTEGGAVYLTNTSEMSMTGGVITLNQSTTNGGAVYVNSSATVNVGKQTLADGTEIIPEITSNTATGTGGAFHLNTSGDLNVSAGKINGNNANYGGAIYAGNKDGEINVTGGEWNNNTARASEWAGGGMLMVNADCTVNLSNATIMGNTSPYGGAIQVNFGGATVSLTNCTLSGNIASNGSGAALYLRGSPTVNLTNTVITGNKSKSGGAVSTKTSNAAVLRLSGSTVIAGNLDTSGNKTTSTDVFFGSNANRTSYIQVNELTEGAHVNVYNDNATELAATTLVQIQSGKTQTNWDCGWITYFYKNAATNKNVAYRDTDSDGTKEFTYGHWHTDANGNEYELLPWVDSDGAAKTTTLPTSGNYYLTANVTVIEATTVNSGSMELCTNGYKISTTGSVRMYAYKSSGNMSIVNCTAAYDQNGHLLAGSEVSGFDAGSNGGVFNTTGASGVLTLSGLEFKGCYDTSTYNKEGNYGYGGGVIQSRDGNGLVVDGCNFINCHSGSTGGAINIRHSGTWKARTITNCVFKNNYAGAAGGAIYAQGNGTSTVLTIDNCIFEGNYATTIKDATTTTAEYSLSGHGGAIFIKYITANVTNSVFTGNSNKHRDGLTTHADTCRGGAIYVYNNSGTALKIDKDVTTSTSFKNNTSANLGGAIWVGDTATIHNAEFTGNSAPNGGAIYGNDTITLKDASFEENTATAAGGAVYSVSPLSLTTCTFTENGATTNGGAVYESCGGTVSITGCDFALNSADSGGAVYVSSNSMTLNVTDTDFTDNTATSYGGALDAEFTSTANVKGCNFDHNTAGSMGGAIITRGKDMTMTIAKNDSGVACTFTNNTAVSGGALAFDTYRGNANTRIVNDAVFTDNSASHGGALYACSAAPSDGPDHCITTITNGTFTGNKASDGSAISANNYSETILDSCTITGNESASASYGAIFVQNENTILTLQGLMDITGNTNASTSNLNADLWLNENTPADGTPRYGTVTVGELTAGSTIGVNADVSRYENRPVIGTVTATNDVSDCFFSNNPDFFATAVNKNGELVLAKYLDEAGNDYQSVAEAMAAVAATSDTFKMQVNTTEEITLPDGISVVDLNGLNIGKITVPAEKTLTLIDSATNGYDAVEGEFGKVKVEGNVESYAVVNNNGTKRYLVIENEDGTVSAHRVYLAINSKLLRPYTYGAGFRAIFAGDETVAKNVKFGIQLYGKDINLATESKTKATFEGMTAGIEGTNTPNQKTVAIKNAITEDDKTNWTDELYGEPFMELNGETYTGTERTLVMKEMAKDALDAVDPDSDTAKYIDKMIKKFALEIA